MCISIQCLCPILSLCTFGSNYTLKLSRMLCHKIGKPFWGRLDISSLQYLSSSIRLDRSHVQTSPEMSTQFQVQATLRHSLSCSEDTPL